MNKLVPHHGVSPTRPKPPSIASLLSALNVDPVRSHLPFDPRFERANELILTAKSDAEAARRLRSWLHEQQPCLFGRIAAGFHDLISFCILAERDLVQPDSVIREKIQAHRLDWKRRAFRGEKSAFILIAVARSLVEAAPDHRLLAFSTRIAELYLLEAVEPDRIYHDRITLEISPDHYREWVAGVNFFGPQADGRWWHDHRMPGGICFSVNAVGHMIRSAQEHNRSLALPEGQPGLSRSLRKKPVDDLWIGLRYAMMTINRAHETVSGRATCLRALPAPAKERPMQACPISPLPPELSGKDWSTYLGWYDTDCTLPSIYFRPDVERPEHVSPLELDFTYLYDEDDPDYFRTGPGIQIR